jgi:hypothetical protein
MRPLGHLLVWIGFLGGAFVAVARQDGLWSLPWFLVALAVGAAGIAMVRIGTRRLTRHEEKLVADITTLRSSLEQVVADVEALDRDKGSLDVYDLAGRIDETFTEHLAAFVDARESIAHRFGLQAYADVMSHFASGERYLNRVWSASTDGYIDEAHEQLGRSHEQFSEALETFRRIAGGTGPGVSGTAPGGGAPGGGRSASIGL